MAFSQCLDDSPGPRLFKREGDMDLQGLYNEQHRLALEELISGGLDSYLAFLKKEKIPNFLSDEEIRRIVSSAVVPRCASVEDFEQSVSSSMDCSSVTYFPDVSDVEPPILEMGWPAFTVGSFRGITRAVAYFQPSYGECIYSCKEAVRRMIKSAKEVIAIVTDSLTDLDIFKDLQEACTRRRVPVYLLLDQSCIPSFLQMCANLNIRLEDLRHMRVRTITGATYFLRSGAKITGKVHERFMLIDGNRAATGSYRFNWTDGKLNSSNLIELSGQITENFDEEFRILYAQSLPLPVPQHQCTRAPLSARNSGIYDHLLHKPSVAPPPPKVALLEAAKLSSTPNRAMSPKNESGNESRQGSPVSDVSTIGEDWMEQECMQDALHADRPVMGADQALAAPTCDASTQTSSSSEDRCMQTDPEAQPLPPLAIAVAGPEPVSRSTPQSESPPRKSAVSPPGPAARPAATQRTSADGHLRDCFRKLTKERQYHYSTIRSKLDHMVMLLAQRRELGDLTNLTMGPSLRRVCKEPGLVSSTMAVVDNSLVPLWPRVRCLQ